MTWKSTALLSGAGLIATWFASAPATVPSAPAASVPAAVAPRNDPAADIGQQAERLRSGLQAHDAYHRPTRNLFRFEERRSEAAAPRAPEPAPAQIAEVPPSPSV